MQTQQPHRPQQQIPQPKAGQATVSPEPWVKPTFEQVPLNEALFNHQKSGANDAFTNYSNS